jgi:phosphoglycolate phosphatase
MKSKECLIIFDLDGTILDTSEGILSSAKFAINTMGYKMPDEEDLKAFIGPPIQDSFAHTFNISGNRLKYMTEIFRNRYKSEDLLKAVPYNGIIDVFDNLKKSNFKIAIATYKRQDYAELIMKYFGFTNYTNIVCGSDFEGKLKKRDIINIALKKSCITENAKVVMIGDTIHDAEGAEQVGINFIGVTYGFGFKIVHEILNDNILGFAEKPKDILKILLGVN